MVWQYDHAGCNLITTKTRSRLPCAEDLGERVAIAVEIKMSSKLIILVAVFSVLAVVNEAGMPFGDDAIKAFREISSSLSKLKDRAGMMMNKHRMRY